MRHAKTGIVQEDEPHIDGDPLGLAELPQHIALAKHAVGDRLDRPIAPGVGLEIDRAVFREIDLSLAMRAQELAGMIAAGDGDGVKPERCEPHGGFADPCFGEVPGIGVDRPVAHGIIAPVIAGPWG